MARDNVPVLDRDLFRERGMTSRGIEDLVENENLQSRREQAMAMIDAAREKFDSKNFQMLTEQDRPQVFRPVAVNMPAQQQTATTAQRMQQMSAQGIRPVGMADGGVVRYFFRGGMDGDALPASEQASSIQPTVSPSGSLDISGPTTAHIVDDGGYYEMTAPPPGAGEIIYEPDLSGREDRRRTRPSSLPYSRGPNESVRGSDREHGVISVLPPEEPEKKKSKSTSSDEEGPTTKIEDIKSERARQREENFNMALIRAGLGIAAGKSSNALSNIGEGGIAGLEQFARAEKEDRVLAAEERKYQEDKASRIQRAAELAQEKKLTREARVYDIASGNIRAIDTEIRQLESKMAEALDESQKAGYRAQIEDLKARRDDNQRTIQQSMGSLGYSGSLFPTTRTSNTRTIDFSGLPPR